jgi:Protein of unknown function (DUF4236)
MLWLFFLSYDRPRLSAMRGFRFRKSINLGLVRINFSKSGVGWSFAVLPGFIRYTRAVNKDRYWTFSIPGTGLSKRTISSRSKNK